MSSIVWESGDLLALASPACMACHGRGNAWNRRHPDRTCHCVHRRIFRICLGKFQKLLSRDKALTTTTLDYQRSGSRKQTWGRKSEEYIADFLLVMKRTLTPAQQKIFRLHFMLGADWKLCCRQLKMEKGDFFHLIYDIENQLGEQFVTIRPYALYPLDEYFGGTTEEVNRPTPPPTPIPPSFSAMVPVARTRQQPVLDISRGRHKNRDAEEKSPLRNLELNLDKLAA